MLDEESMRAQKNVEKASSLDNTQTHYHRRPVRKRHVTNQTLGDSGRNNRQDVLVSSPGASAQPGKTRWLERFG